MYVPLRVHGWHSLLTGVDPPASLLARAGELGLPALALADVDTLCGSVEFLRDAERARASDPSSPRPILGAEVSDPTGRPGRVIALVRDEVGYRNLCKLVSARRLGDDPGDPAAKLDGPAAFSLVDAVTRFRAGLAFLVDHPRLAFALAGRLATEELFVAISPVALTKKQERGSRRRRPRALQDEGGEALDDPKVPPPSQAVPAAELVRTARALGLATLAVPDVYWAFPEGFEHHRVRTAIKHNALRCDLPDEWLAERPGHLLAPGEMAALYADLPDVPGPLSAGRSGHPGALRRTLEVADACRFVPALGGVLFPEIELEPDDTPYSRLSVLAFEGARKRYAPLRPEVVRRLDYELAAIHDLGYAPYFLLVRRIADFARAQGIPHVGRGSAADSLVAYCLELTDADPLRYKLPFERFLNPARRDRPDIDLDFCWRRRDEVLAHVGQAFGADRTAMISTLNRFGLRAAFREAALAEGIPPVEVNRWSRRLPWMVSSADGATPFDGDGTGEADAFEEPEEQEVASKSETLAAEPGPSSASPWWVGARDGGEKLPPDLADNPLALSFAATPECRDFPFDDARYAFVLRSAAALLDAPRHLGLHPGGVVASPGPITDVVSCQRATKGCVMTQLDKDGVEAIGLVKMDLLGNRALTVIDDCLRSLAADGVEAPDLAALSEQDPATANLLARGRTIGCFQVESPGMRNLLQQIGSRSMDDVIQAVALIRPGPAGSGMKDAFVRRFRGKEEPEPPHPRLAELLRETHGVMLYQEDVMQAVVLLAGMDLSSADELRRALAKRRAKELERLRRAFEDGCRRKGVEPADVRRVWELVSNFSSFGFCKAHAVTYGRIAYRAVYLKAHYPAAYLTAFLNSRTGYYETRVYVEEARRLGVPILPPDVNRSRLGFRLEGAAIRIGLDRVKGLSERTCATLLEEREKNGSFLSLPDFLVRTRARVDETEHLIQVGAFDAFDRTRPEMLWRLHLLTTPVRRPPRDLVREQGALDANVLAACRTTPDERARRPQGTGGWSQAGMGVGGLELRGGESARLFPEPETPALALPALPETDAPTRGRLELELLGLTVIAHPTDLFSCDADERVGSVDRHGPRIPCREIAAHAGRRVHVRGWLAASRRVRTADRRWMRFLTLEDVSGLAEVVLFPDVYERDGHRLTHRGPHVVCGRVEDQLGACTLHAESIL